MNNQFSIGDVIFVDGKTYQIAPYVNEILALIPIRECEVVGCTNPALDRTTSAGTATSVRVCAACAEAM